MKLTQAEKIKIHTARNNLTMLDVYKEIGISRTQGYHKLISNKFTDEELGVITSFLNVKPDDLKGDK